MADSRNANLPHPKTHFVMREWASRADWERYRNSLRWQILSASGLLPMSRRTPPMATVVRRNIHPGFRTEALLLETLPGFFVGCTVYTPQDTTRRYPVVLVPHGHWKRGRVEHLTSYSVPALAANLAMQGYVAFTWDMLGYNDTRQLSHDFGGWREQLWGFTPLGLQVWNGMRVLDYAQTRPDVDARRVGCTGASGGGTQTILLSAADRRITCSAPVNMVSASYQGADPCEEAPNLRLGSNNVEIAALSAPRPMLLVSCTGDWTRNTPREEFPALQRIWTLYNRQDVLSNAHFDAEHNYNRETRQAVYPFLARHLQQRTGSTEEIVERGIDPFRPEDLLSSLPAPPPNALTQQQLFEQWQDNSRRRTDAERRPRSTRLALTRALHTEWPQDMLSIEDGERVFLSRPNAGDRVPALFLRGRGTPAILIHPEGSEAALRSAEAKQIRAEGRPLLAPDVFQTGLAQASRDRSGRWFLSYNQTDDACRIQDIVTVAAWLRRQIRDQAELIGIGKAALWVVFAAAVMPEQPSVVADLRNWKGTDEELRENCFVPCLQQAGGIWAATKLIRRLRFAL